MGRPAETGSTVFYWALVLAWMTAIFTFSSFSTLPDPGGFQISDKVKHFSAYAVLAFLAFRAAGATWRGWTAGKIAFAAIVISGIYGATDEFHQYFIPGRCCDYRDWLADMAGAVAVALIAFILSYLHRRD